MKRILFLLLISFPLLVQAALDEFVIPTADKSCAIRYLTQRTKYNWTIQVNPESCKNGWVDGAAKVQLFSPLKEPTETLTGFFKEGYWLDDFPPIGEIIERTSPEEKVQSLSFLLGKDTEAGITYIGQLRAIQPKNRPYTAFQGCPDFRILVVVSDKNIFQNTAFQDKIVKQGLFYARSYCPKPTILALFGATKTTQPDIFFHMQVIPETEEREILPLSPKTEENNATPLEIRKEKSDMLMSVDPKEKEVIVSYTKNPTGKIVQRPEFHKNEKKILNHLQILEKASGQAVKGRVAVHIKNLLLDGTGITDLPDEIQLLYYPNLKTGWAVVEGTLENNKMQVSDVQFCRQEWCIDVP